MRRCAHYATSAGRLGTPHVTRPKPKRSPSIRAYGADDLDQLRDRNRAHEVYANELFRTIRGGGEPRDRDRRRVGGEDSRPTEMRCQRLEDRVLDFLALGRRLDVADAERGVVGAVAIRARAGSRSSAPISLRPTWRSMFFVTVATAAVSASALASSITTE